METQQYGIVVEDFRNMGQGGFRILSGGLPGGARLHVLQFLLQSEPQSCGLLLDRRRSPGDCRTLQCLVSDQQFPITFRESGSPVIGAGDESAQTPQAVLFGGVEGLLEQCAITGLTRQTIAGINEPFVDPAQARFKCYAILVGRDNVGAHVRYQVAGLAKIIQSAAQITCIEAGLAPICVECITRSDTQGRGQGRFKQGFCSRILASPASELRQPGKEVGGFRDVIGVGQMPAFAERRFGVCQAISAEKVPAEPGECPHRRDEVLRIH